MIAAYDEEYARTSALVGQPFEVRLGVYLWRSSMTEQIAAGGFEKIARWEWLSREEQWTARVFAQEEREHAEALRALGQEFIPRRPDEFLRRLFVPDEPWMLLVGISQAERISFVGFEKMRGLGERLGHAGMVEAYDKIAREERRHLTWGQPLMRRVLADPTLGPPTRAYARSHPIAREYRAVRQERPWQ